MITNPANFQATLSADFDGVFHWDFLKGAFPRGIMPTDWDGVVEINGYFIVFETKDIGKRVSKGQRLALQRAVATGRFTVIFLWGKRSPVRWERHTRTKVFAEEGCDEGTVFAWVKKWADWADKEAYKPPELQVVGGVNAR